MRTRRRASAQHDILANNSRTLTTEATLRRHLDTPGSQPPTPARPAVCRDSRAPARPRVPGPAMVALDVIYAYAVTAMMMAACGGSAGARPADAAGAAHDGSAATGVDGVGTGA